MGTRHNLHTAGVVGKGCHEKGDKISRGTLMRQVAFLLMQEHRQEVLGTAEQSGSESCFRFPQWMVHSFRSTLEESTNERTFFLLFLSTS